MANIKAYGLINKQNVSNDDVLLIETDAGTKTIKAKDLVNPYDKNQIDNMISEISSSINRFEVIGNADDAIKNDTMYLLQENNRIVATIIFVGDADYDGTNNVSQYKFQDRKIYTRYGSASSGSVSSWQNWIEFVNSSTLAISLQSKANVSIKIAGHDLYSDITTDYIKNALGLSGEDGLEETIEDIRQSLTPILLDITSLQTRLDTDEGIISAHTIQLNNQDASIIGKMDKDFLSVSSFMFDENGIIFASTDDTVITNRSFSNQNATGNSYYIWLAHTVTEVQSNAFFNANNIVKIYCENSIESTPLPSNYQSLSVQYGFSPLFMYLILHSLESLLANGEKTSNKSNDFSLDTTPTVLEQTKYPTVARLKLLLGENYYDSEEIDELLNSIDLSDYYTKSEIDEALSDYYNKSEIDTELSGKEEKISEESPLALALSVGDIPYSIGKLFYSNNKVYRYTSYRSVDGGMLGLIYDVTKSVHIGTSAPKSSENVRNLGVGSYEPGDIYFRKTSNVSAIYLCEAVSYEPSSQPVTSTTSLIYTYTWKEMPLKSDTLAGYGIENAYTKSEIDDMLGIGFADHDMAGIQIDFENSVFTRLAGAANKNAGTDFNIFPMYGNRRRCNVADDGTINAFYGDGNYTENGSNGQVMVYQPVFWYKVVPLKLEPNTSGVGYHIRKANYYVCSTPKVGFKRHPLFYDANGKEIDYVLLSAFEGSYYDVSESTYVNDETGAIYTDDDIETGDLLCSVAGKKPISGGLKPLNRPGFETIASNRGSGWHLDTIKSIAANQLLMMIEFGTPNLQSVNDFRGIVDIDASVTGDNCSCITGSTSYLGNATGSAQDTICDHGSEQTHFQVNGKVAISYRGQENPWGNIYKHIQGFNLWGNGNMDGGQFFICDDFTYTESKHDGNYKPTGFSISPSSGYASAFGYGFEKYDWLIVPSEVLGTSSLPVGDYIRVATNLNGHRGTIFGGNWSEEARAGIFDYQCSIGLSGMAKWYIGGRLLYIPAAVV